MFLTKKNKTQSAYLRTLNFETYLLQSMACWDYWPAVLLLLRLDHDLNEKIEITLQETITWDPPKGKFGKSSTQKVIWEPGYVSSQEGILAK